MGSLSYTIWSVKYLLCVIYVFTKYFWVTPLKGKKGKTVLHGLVEIVKESKWNQLYYTLIKEKNFMITICKNS